MSLRVFIATDSTPNAEFASQIWRHNLVLPWKDLGHDVVEFDYNLRQTFLWVDPHVPEHAQFIARNRPIVSQALLQQVRAAHQIKPIDLFFSYFYDACVTPETIDEIKKMGIPTMNWYCNGSYQLHLVEKLSPHFDWCLVPEKFRLDDYRRLGAHPIYCQEAANPNLYKPYPLIQDKDVTFVGQCYGNRPEYIQYLLAQGIPVEVFGARWRDLNNPEVKFLQKLIHLTGRKPSDVLGPILADEDVVKMFNRSKINLGFSVCGFTHLTGFPIRQVRLRDFEVPMSGGFYLCEYFSEIEEFFTPDKEIVCFQTREELRDKIKFYLENDAARKKIQWAGYERARREHTWHKRFEMVLETAGFSTPQVHSADTVPSLS